MDLITNWELGSSAAPLPSPYASPSPLPLPLPSIQNASSTPFEPVGSFRFLDLPSELRVAVYSHLLPFDHRIRFNSRDNNNSSPAWTARAEPNDTKDNVSKRTVVIGGVNRIVGSRSGIPLHKSTQTSLFLVNKLVSGEAKAILYGSNTYKLRIDGDPHTPISIQSPLIFGPLGLPHRIHLLRDLRHIDIDIAITEHSHWATKRHRGRLEHFVNILKQHADDKNQRSLLKHLKIRVIRHFHRTPGVGMRGPLATPTEDPQYSETFMFALESLAKLRGIEEVQIAGVTDWFAQCLVLCIRGQGGDVLETEWPLVEIRRKRRPNSKKVAVWVTTRKWYQPTLNWKEFAEQNNIEVPDDIEKFWAAAS